MIRKYQELYDQFCKNFPHTHLSYESFRNRKTYKNTWEELVNKDSTYGRSLYLFKKHIDLHGRENSTTYSSFCRRVRKGWSDEKCVNTPKGKSGPIRKEFMH